MANRFKIKILLINLLFFCGCVYIIKRITQWCEVRLKEGKQEWVADSTGEEVSLWQKMMQFPDSWAEGSLPLRSSMGKQK